MLCFVFRHSTTIHPSLTLSINLGPLGRKICVSYLYFCDSEFFCYCEICHIELVKKRVESKSLTCKEKLNQFLSIEGSCPFFSLQIQKNAFSELPSSGRVDKPAHLSYQESFLSCHADARRVLSIGLALRTFLPTQASLPMAQKKNTSIYLAAALLFAGGLAWLLFSGLSENSVYFLNVADPTAQATCASCLRTRTTRPSPLR